MIDKENVIANAIEQLDWYFNEDDGCASEKATKIAYRYLKEIVLALLKGQEARVVTTADFENNPNLDDGGHLNVWEEYKDGTRYRWNTINVNDVRAFTDIHRYWTSRPTPEQMRDTPWEGDSDAE